MWQIFNVLLFQKNHNLYSLQSDINKNISRHAINSQILVFIVRRCSCRQFRHYHHRRRHLRLRGQHCRRRCVVIVLRRTLVLHPIGRLYRRTWALFNCVCVCIRVRRRRGRFYRDTHMHTYMRARLCWPAVQRHPEYRMWRHSRTWPNALSRCLS